jgi:hypothetical protein
MFSLQLLESEKEKVEGLSQIQKIILRLKIFFHSIFFNSLEEEYEEQFDPLMCIGDLIFFDFKEIIKNKDNCDLTRYFFFSNYFLIPTIQPAMVINFSLDPKNLQFGYSFQSIGDLNKNYFINYKFLKHFLEKKIIYIIQKDQNK